MIDFLIAAGGVFVGFMLRSVLPARPPVDHFWLQDGSGDLWFKITLLTSEVRDGEA